jgi:starch synthase
MSFMAQAVLWADMVSTVSETYAREITTPEYGVGLDALLRYRSSEGNLMGIINGIDYEYWNTSNDPYLPVNFSPSGMAKRTLNKTTLQRVAGLPVDSDIPLIGMVQRLDEQKGIDIVVQGADRILQETGAQLVILGRGRDNYENALRQIAARYQGQVSVFIAFEEPLAHLIYGGCDIFLMPSHFEPCGLGQMIAMRYGAIPIVRHTGGLVDTVPQLSPDLSTGNGFVFHEYSPEALVKAVLEATNAFKNKPAWQRAIQRVSRMDFSWQNSARRYETAYQQVLEKNKRD